MLLLHSKIYTLNSVSVVFLNGLKRHFKICTLIASKVNFLDFYLYGGLHAVPIGKPSEQMSNFWTVRFFKKTESEQDFGFPHNPITQPASIQ